MLLWESKLRLTLSRALRAAPFKVLVGKDRDCFNIPATLAKDISQPLYTLMSGGEMKEAQSGVADLEEVESDTFTGFCEYAYTGEYQVPTVTVDFGPITTAASPLMIAEGAGASKDLDTVLDEALVECHTESALEQDSWGFGVKKSKKDKKRSRTQDIDFNEPEPAISMPSKVDSRSDTVKKHSQYLWTEFCSLNYEEPSEKRKTATSYGHARQTDFKPLLFHCKLYVFAQTYLITTLKQLTLRKLHARLAEFDLSLETSEEVLEALEFTFVNTERREDGDDELRKLLVAYVVSKTHILKQSDRFRTLLDGHGELGSDIVQALS